MKIKQMKLENFAKFSDFEIEFDGKITRLLGINGSGKTTVGLTAIWAGFKGIAERGREVLIGERFRFIGQAGKTASISIMLEDEKTENKYWLHRKISSNSNSILITSEDGTQITDNFITDLLDVSFLSAKHFCSLSGTDQALRLGINTKEFDNKVEVLKIEASEVRKEIKKWDVAPVEKAERIDLEKLKQELLDGQNHNELQAERANEITNINYNISDLEKEIERLKKEIELRENSIKEFKETLSEMPPPEGRIDIDAIQEKIYKVSDHNEKAFLYEQYIENKQKFDLAKKDLEANLKVQEKTAFKRLSYIQQFNFPFDGLSVNTDGILELNNKPIQSPYFSKGELEMIVAKLHSAINPEMKVRFIDDFDLLDEKNQKEIVEYLFKKKFQIITAEVGEKSGKDVIVLRECQIKKEKSKKENLI